MGNQLLAEVHIEQPRTRVCLQKCTSYLLQLSKNYWYPLQQADSPTFNRAAIEEEEEEVDGEGEEEMDEQEVRVSLPSSTTHEEEPMVWKVQCESSIWYTWYSVWRERSIVLVSSCYVRRIKVLSQLLQIQKIHMYASETQINMCHSNTTCKLEI